MDERKLEVYSLRLMEILKDKGIMYETTRENQDFPEYDVFIYPYSFELRQMIKEYRQSAKEN